MQLVMFGGVAVFPTVMAFAIALTGGYTAPFVLLALLALIGSVMVRSAAGRADARRDERL